MLKQNLNLAQLEDEIAVLKLRLERETHRITQNGGRSQLDGLQGLVLNEKEIFTILTGNLGAPVENSDLEFESKIEKLERQCALQFQAAKPSSALQRLSKLFALDRIEQQCLVLCLAAEIEPKLARVYAFLQDDATRKLPSVELFLRLFCGTKAERIGAHTILSSQAPLRRYKLIQLQNPEDSSGPLSLRWLRLDERIAAFLLGVQDLDSVLANWLDYSTCEHNAAGHPLPDELLEQTTRLAHACLADGELKTRPILHLYGRFGAGMREVAEHVCRCFDLPLLIADVRRMPPGGDRQDLWWRLGRESLLQPAGIFVAHFDDLLDESRAGERLAFLDAAEHFSPLTFLSGSASWNGIQHIRRNLFVSLECRGPTMSTKVQLWKHFLGQIRHHLTEGDIHELSCKFDFTPGQIQNAISAAQATAVWRSQMPMSVDMRMLNEACRGQAVPNLGLLARHVRPTYGWADLVLPDEIIGQLREIVSHVRQSRVVLEKWGFERKLQYGRGVTGLFHGGSGTGKTTAVSVIAADLGLDLYKVDLSMLVSKYIGETEKNLNRVFAEAQCSNAILFFDEADALFGKRSQVKDAHDRYANIETAYLLQRMEEYTGIVVLASNMKANMDDAFVRRLRFILHFPFPSQAERERIWRGAFPAETALGADVDLSYLAWKLNITGGTIKNISLRAAFLAAERNSVIDMDCLKAAAAHELAKSGTVADLTDFPSTAQSVMPKAQGEAA